jgi:hypothetical protein
MSEPVGFDSVLATARSAAARLGVVFYVSESCSDGVWLYADRVPDDRPFLRVEIDGRVSLGPPWLLGLDSVPAYSPDSLIV